MEPNIETFKTAAYSFILSHPEEWKLDGDVDLEVLNHVLRVWIQDGTIANHREDVLRLIGYQHADGGFGDTRDDGESRLRSTSFCAQMMLRANRMLRDGRIEASIVRALDYILRNQLPDGSWRDHKWHLLDAVSTSVGTLLFAVNESFARAEHKAALDRGMQFVFSQQQHDGAWYYKPTGSPVTITAHLLQKCATYGAGCDVVVPAMRRVLELQDPAGHWDKENTDHTCDASRALMNAASTEAGAELVAEVSAAVEKALTWILATANNVGLGDRPGKTPHVERTCDGLDFALKFVTFRQQRSTMQTFWR